MKTVTFDETKWQLVPVEPTPEMLDSCGTGAGGLKRRLWAAMLAAAPVAPALATREGGEA